MHAVFVSPPLHLISFTIAKVSAEVACSRRTKTIAELGHMLWPNLAVAPIEQRLSLAMPHSEVCVGQGGDQNMHLT